MSLKFYGYPKCGTCRNAQKRLAEHGISFEFIDVFQNPPTLEELQLLVERSGLDIRKFYNTSGEVYKELQLKDKLPTMSYEEQLRLLAANGKLIKRPVVTDGTKVTVGFREEDFDKAWAGRE